MGEDGTRGAPTRGTWLALVLALVVGAAYANALGGGFHFDDWHALEQNPHLRSLANLPRFFVDPATTTVLRENRDLRPVLLVSFALDYALAGTATWSWHLTNVVLHWLVVVLVFRIVRDHLWLGAAGLPVAAGAALVVAVHPLNTEPVNYLSARSALLTAVFYLAAFDAGVRRRRAACLVLFALALLTKAIAVTFPVILLGYWLVDRAQAPAASRPAIPWGFLAAVAAVDAAGGLYRAWLVPSWLWRTTHEADVTPWVYLMTEWSAYLYYVRLFLWPDALVVDRLDYAYTRALGEPRAWASLAVLLAVAMAAWRVRRRAPAFTFAALWYFVALAAESTLFPLAEPVNEHRPYLGMLGLGTAAGLALWWLAGLAAGMLGVRPARALAVMLAVLTATLGTATWARNRVWRDEYALWLDATRKAPTNARAWLNAGHAAMERGDLAEARTLLLEAHRLRPCCYVQMNLGCSRRRGACRVAPVGEAVGCNRDIPLPHRSRGAALVGVVRTADAREAYRRATVLDVRDAEAWLALGRLGEERSEWTEAAAAFDAAFAANPAFADTAMRAGLLYHHRLGQPALAVERYRAVLGLVPGHYGARYQIATALLASGRTAEAVEAWREFVPLAEASGDRGSLEGAPAALRAAR
jgi:tetratricopeptide (TPR) repeat protein